MKKTVFSFFLFLVMSATVVGLLKVVNWLPMTFQNDTLRRYNSIEEVKTSLNIRSLHVPAYFPQTIAWPPAHIVAQAKPSLTVLMKFNRRDSAQEALVIMQAESDSFPRHAPGEFSAVTERVLYQLHGRPAVLEVGTCENEEPCSRMSWQEGKYRLIVFMRSAPFELIKIAESMLHP